MLSPENEKISIVSIAELARDEGGYSRFVVIDKRVEALTCLMQRLEEEMNRTAEPRTSPVPVNKLRRLCKTSHNRKKEKQDGRTKGL